jgi:hypothetical protein
MTSSKLEKKKEQAMKNSPSMTGTVLSWRGSEAGSTIHHKSPKGSPQRAVDKKSPIKKRNNSEMPDIAKLYN